MKNKLTLILAFLLCFSVTGLVVVEAQSRMRAHGASIIFSSAGALTLTPRSGQAVTVGGPLTATGNFSVNTNKFTVAAASGNTAVAGTLGVTGASTLTGGATIGSGGTAITKVLRGTVAIDPASIATDAVSSQTFTLTGAVVGDSIEVNPPAAGLTAGLVVSHVYVSAADTITIVFHNTTGDAIDEASASWTYLIVR